MQKSNNPRIPNLLAYPLLLLFFIGSWGQLSGQSSSTFWYASKFFKIMGDPNLEEEGQFCLEDQNGNYFYIGLTKHSPSNSTKDILVIKMDPDGNPIWQKRLESDAGSQIISSRVPSALVLNNGDLLLALGSGGQPAYSRVSGTTGNPLWTKRVDGTNNFASSRLWPELEFVPGGGFIGVRSFSTFVGSNIHEGFEITKVDANGNVVWYRANARDVTGSNLLEFRIKDVEINTDGTIAILCQRIMSGGTATGLHEMALFKTDATGNMTSYAYAYDNTGQTDFFPIALANYSPGVYGILGNYYDSPDAQLYYIRTSNNGDVALQKRYSCSEGELILVAPEDPAGTASAVGYKGNDIITVGASLTGTMSVTSQQQPVFVQFPRSLSPASDGRRLIAGDASDDMMLRKTGAGGSSPCDPEYLQCLNLESTSGIVKSALPLAYSESPTVTAVPANYSLVQYSDNRPGANRCIEESEWKPNDPPVSDPIRDKTAFEAIALPPNFYPNPASGNVTLEAGLEQGQTGEVRILNLLGQHLKSMPLNGGQIRHQLPVQDLTPGTYLFELNIDSGPRSYHKVMIKR